MNRIGSATQLNCRNCTLNVGIRQLVVGSGLLTIHVSTLDDMRLAQTDPTTWRPGSGNQRPFCLIRGLAKTSVSRLTLSVALGVPTMNVVLTVPT